MLCSAEVRVLGERLSEDGLGQDSEVQVEGGWGADAEGGEGVGVRG